MALTVPIAFIAFNRPQHTAESFAVIREQRPSDLFLIVDGPRDEHDSDPDRCRKVRNVLEGVDWPCKVRRIYAASNLGLKRRVSSGLDKVFSEVDCAIVIEDDCVPSADFFHFCESLLERYRDDDRVVAITGDNFQDGIQRGDASYYFSKYMHCWGWATWRRSWQSYDAEISFWPAFKNSNDWVNIHPDRTERRYWNRILDRVSKGEIDTWAYPWQANLWYRTGLTATPNVNLVENTGFGPDSTHTGQVESPNRVRAGRLGPLTHPRRVLRDFEADSWTFDRTYGGAALRPPRRPWKFLKWLLVRVLQRVLPSRIKSRFRGHASK